MAKAKPKAATKPVKKLTKGALIQGILESMGEGWARKDVELRRPRVDFAVD